MEIVLVILAFIFLAAGIVGAVLPILPGLPLSFAGLLVLQWSGYGNFSIPFLWIWAIIAIVITIADYFLPSKLVKKFGGSRAASIGSVLGLLAGIFVFPPLGIIVGPFIGAFLGELIFNKANGDRAFKVAFAAFLAFIVGTGAKLIASSLMLFFAIRAVL